MNAVLGFLGVFSLVWDSPAPSFIHSGTPPGVPVETDCAMRKLAYEFGKKQAPQKVRRERVSKRKESPRESASHVQF